MRFPLWERKLSVGCVLTLLDGILHLLRNLRDQGILSVVSQGEACVIHMSMFAPEARQAAYAERSVTQNESEVLEEVAEAVTHSVFIAPLLLPKATLAQVRDFLP